MKPDHLKKINSWFMDKIAVVEKEGASVEDFEDPSVADLALREIFEEHFDDMRKDSDLMDEAFAVSTKASWFDLREVAAQAKQEDLEIGHYLELVAHYRENQPPSTELS
jgi:hypothetical protein